MLSKEKLHEIEIEEHFRFQTRRTLETSAASGHPRDRLWRFLNSSFGLFLCSSVVLASITGLYSSCTQRHERRLAAGAEINEIIVEIDYRVRQMEFWRSRLAVEPSDTTPEVNIWRILVGNKEYQPTLPVFERSHAYGLVFRLDRLGVRSNNKAALTTIVELENLGRRVEWRYDAKTVDPLLERLRTYRDSLVRELNRGSSGGA